MSDFTMPSLGADMEAGTLVEWLVGAGDVVARGDIVAVVETQKGAIEIEIFESGRIAEILVGPGEKVPVGTVLARIEAPGAPVKRTPAKKAPAAKAPAKKAPAKKAPAKMAPPKPAPPMPAPPIPPAGARLRVSPAARRRAQELGLEIAGIAGTGAGGAITLADIEAAAERAPAPAAAVPAAAPAGTPQASMRQAIAAAMSRANREIPHYYLSRTIEMEAALGWLEATNAQRPIARRLIAAVLLLRAVAVALRDFPDLNGFWIDGAARPAAHIHVGWSVSLRGGGLVAPAILDADTKPLETLMAALRDLVKRARAGGLRSSEMSAQTVTVTSLGDLGADAVHGVIYPPQLALVGFGRVRARPWVVGEDIAPRRVVEASLAADHRASDGHRGGLFLAALDKLLQEPETL